MADRGLERFWGASGMPAPLRLLVWERGRREPAEHVVTRPFAIVGRTPPADLVLAHPQVSRRHAYVQVIGGRAYCLDLGSRSAIGWAGGPRRSGWIEPGRPVEIGPYRIGVAEGGPAPSRATAGDPLAEPGPEAVRSVRFLLESSDGASPGRNRWPVDRALTSVGRAPDCRIRLADLSISRLHCTLVRLDDALWIVDLLGRGGIELNGRRLRWAPLHDGDLLRLGRYLFAVRSESPPTLRIRDNGPRPARLSGPDARQRPTSLALAAPAPPPMRMPPLSPIVAALRMADPDAVAIESPVADTVRVAEALIAPLVDQFALMQQHLFDQYHQSMMEMMAMVNRLQHDQQGMVDREMRKIRRLTREVRSLRRELDRRREEGDGQAPGGSGGGGGVARLPAPGPGGPSGEATRSTPRGSPEDYRAAQARIIARMAELQQERQGRWQRLLGRLASGGEGEEPR